MNTLMDSPDPAALEQEIKRHCDAGDLQAAATAALTGYGAEIFGYLMAVLRSETDAGEVFAAFSEALWKDLGRFRWQSSFRTWAYVLARHAVSRQRRDPFRCAERAVPLSRAPEVFEIADKVRTATLQYLRTEVKDRVALLREQLAPEEQSLIILRINRRMSWNEIARIMYDGGVEEPDQAELGRQAAARRKQFQRAKERLRQLAEEQQLID
jgi:RNA polymerase sigma-70 factor, ECF subfamily